MGSSQNNGPFPFGGPPFHQMQQPYLTIPPWLRRDLQLHEQQMAGIFGMRGQGMQQSPWVDPEDRPVTSTFSQTDENTYYRDPKKLNPTVLKAVRIRKEIYRSACRHCGSHFKDLREKCENCGSNSIEDLHKKIEKKDARIEYQHKQLMAMQQQAKAEKHAKRMEEAAILGKKMEATPPAVRDWAFNSH